MLIPVGAVVLIVYWFKSDIRTVIRDGGLKVATPGFSFETAQRQQEEMGDEEKEEIASLNIELEKSKRSEKLIRQLQEYTARDKDTFFLGYHFEKTYRLAFPSQMAILNLMYNQNGEAPSAIVQSIFHRTIWAQQWKLTYEQFIYFLVQTSLVVHDSSEDKLLLTPMGKTFMEYLISNNIPLKLPATDIIV